MSMEEEQARQAAAAQASAPAPVPATIIEPTIAASIPNVPSSSVPAEPTDDDEEAMTQQALAMSEGTDVEMAEHAGEEGDEEMSEEEAIARAIEMSMKGQEEGDKK